jgi:hypothetical protein
MSGKRLVGPAWVRRALVAPAIAGPALAGIYLRYAYAFRAHSPQRFVSSDAMMAAELAEKLVTPGAHQQFFDTLWPPGTASLLATSSLFDPTLADATRLWFVLCCLTPLLIAHAAWMAAGRRAAAVALVLASLAFPLIHYSGFFLSEQPCQTAFALAVWTTVLALRAETPRGKVAAGTAAGLAWALAATFRPNVLPVAFVVALVLGARWLKRAKRSRLLWLAGFALGAALALNPVSHRCSSLLHGSPCLVSSNGPMNVLMGHAGAVRGVHFIPPPGPLADGPNLWFPPALSAHGNRGVLKIPVSPYDTLHVLGWTLGRAFQHPWRFAVASVGNAMDLFGIDYWPYEFGQWKRRTVRVAAQAYLLLVLVPALAAWAAGLRRWLLERDADDVEVMLLAAVGGVLLSSAAALGSPRYRAPFDALFIVLAASLYARARLTAKAEPSRGQWRGLAAMSAVVVGALAWIVAISDPAIQLGQRLAEPSAPRGPAPRVLKTIRPSEIAGRIKNGTRWNALGTQRIACDSDCPELRIALGAPSHAGRVVVAADCNDRYEIGFYHAGQRVAVAAWGPKDGCGGMHHATLDVPRVAVRDGYDALGIRPLFGDGRYAVGDLQLR